jgi:cytochrome c-type biogenesis protein CcmH/NrfG
VLRGGSSIKSNESDEQLEKMLTELIEVATDRLFAHAAQLARNGKYLQSEKILNMLIAQAAPSAKFLVLLGKVYAQQGRYREAIDQWHDSLEIEPENKEALAATKRAEQKISQESKI